MKPHNVIILNTSLSQCKPGMQDAMPRPTPFSTLLNRPDKLKDVSKNLNGQINLSGLLVFHQLIFMVKLP